jgi:hypothetical protein
MCANGQYTKINQNIINNDQAFGLQFSAVAPAITDIVIIANIS